MSMTIQELLDSLRAIGVPIPVMPDHRIVGHRIEYRRMHELSSLEHMTAAYAKATRMFQKRPYVDDQGRGHHFEV
jgi:hypothetical protein